MIMKPGPQLKLPLWFSLSARQHQFFCREDFTGKEFHQLHTKKTMLLLSYSGNRALQIVLCE